MDKQSALDFLRTHQPMPPDVEMSGEEIKTYGEVRRYFIANPDTECISLFLHSFGDGLGFGNYQIVDDVLLKYVPEEVVPKLVGGLRDENRSIRFWCAEMAASFPNPLLVEPLRDLIIRPKRIMRGRVVMVAHGAAGW